MNVAVERGGMAWHEEEDVQVPLGLQQLRSFAGFKTNSSLIFNNLISGQDIQSTTRHLIQLEPMQQFELCRICFTVGPTFSINTYIHTDFTRRILATDTESLDLVERAMIQENQENAANKINLPCCPSQRAVSTTPRWWTRDR